MAELLSANFFRAYARGYYAGEQGRPDNPYHDRRKVDGRLTFSRYWRKLWQEGFEDGQAHRPYRYLKKGHPVCRTSRTSSNGENRSNS